MEINFIDAQQLHKDFPGTFKVPPPEALDKLTAGDLVKIAVDSERFWVRIEGVDGEKVAGHVYSDLILTDYHGLKAQDRIEFEKRHIYMIN